MPQARAFIMPAMPVKLIRTHLALAGASVVLLVLAFPRPGWGWLAHVALVPITVLAIRSYSAKRLAWTTFLAGWLWWLVMIRWMIVIDWGGYAAVAAFMGLYVAAAMLLVRWFHRCYRGAMVLTLPMVWVSLEIIRGAVPAGGWGWYSLADSQAPFLPGQGASTIIQVADLFGWPTVGFLVAMSNGLLVDLVTRPLIKRADRFGRRRLSRTLWAGAGLWLAAMLGAWGYGVVRIRGEAEATRPGPEVAIVQTNEPQNNKEHPTPESLQRDFDRLLGLTRQALTAQPKPDLIVWPETILPYPVNPDARSIFAGSSEERFRAWNRYHQQTADLVASSRVNLLAGAATWQFTEQSDLDRKYNSVYLYLPDGSQYPQWYNKINRVPFGEFIPWVEDWPWLKKQFIRYLSPYQFDYTLDAGTDLVVFPIQPPPARPGLPPGPVLRVATPICFEDTISRLTRRMVYSPDGQKRADMLVNLTNDGWFTGGINAELHPFWARFGGPVAWFARSDEQVQHLQIAVLRSVELRVPMARSVNTGVSGFIDSTGRISPVVEVGGQMENVEGTVQAAVRLDSRSSLYGRLGPMPAAVLVMVTALLALAGLLRPRGRGEARGR